MKLFNLKNSQIIKELLRTKARFTFPARTQFGELDKVCTDIIHELKKRNFDIPGIKIQFCSVFSKIFVEEIISENFKLKFSSAEIHQINIPKKQLNIYSDESGPTFYLYVGKDWEKHKKNFMFNTKLYSRLNRNPRRHLKYKGAFGEPGTELASSPPKEEWSKTRRPFLNHDNDEGKEYNPIGDEPKYFRTENILVEFTFWLQENVLDYIIAHPLPEKEIEFFPF